MDVSSVQHVMTLLCRIVELCVYPLFLLHAFYFHHAQSLFGKSLET